MVYIKLNLKIEQISGILEFLLVKLSMAGIILTSVIITIRNYYFLDLGLESFYLPYPLMYARNYLSSVSFN